ncbi:MAG: D-hydroxyproline dehydrogenase subunit gamma [Bryobacterales bacterium]|jgi:sarcosine oxidase subunit alpha|nr:D-hydroxyproline dehydrogenase subunit gamma [Bryobacterales bacterium]
MAECIVIRVNGHAISVRDGITVAVALLQADELHFRTSVTGEPRAPLCGMGICFECRVTINGHTHARSCQILVREGMQVVT